MTLTNFCDVDTHLKGTFEKSKFGAFFFAVRALPP